MSKEDSPTTSVPEDVLFDKIIRILGIERRLATTQNLIKRDKVKQAFESYGNHRELEGQISENMYYWHRQRALHEASKNGLVSQIFLDRKEYLESQKEIQ